MSDWIAFWTFFGRKNEGWPVGGWRIGKGNRLTEVEKGDRLWLITSGEKAKSIVPDALRHVAYLMEIMTIERIIPDKRGRFAFRIEAQKDGIFKIDPPLLVDRCVRPTSAEPERAIGAYFMGARRLADLVLDALERELKRNCPDLYHEIFHEQ